MTDDEGCVTRMGMVSRARGWLGSRTSRRPRAVAGPGTGSATARDASLQALVEIARGMYGAVPGTDLHVDGRSSDRHSAVWRAKLLRANILSSLPRRTVRIRDGVPYDVQSPRSLVTPFLGGGYSPDVDFTEFLWGSQWDLDTYGVTMGIIHARDAFGLPAIVEPVPMDYVSISMSYRRIRSVRVDGFTVPSDQLWIESQYRLPGYDIGMSPVRHAAMSIGAHIAAQQYSADWFARRKNMPDITLKNKDVDMVSSAQAAEVRTAWMAAIDSGLPHVLGASWDWSATSVKAEDAGFIELMQWGINDIARFFDVPASLLEAGGTQGTYSNVTQQQVSLLVNHIDPVVRRREATFSKWLPRPRELVFNTRALLRMDPEQQARVFKTAVDGRWITPDEVREEMGYAPLTPEQIDMFNTLFPKGAKETPSGKNPTEGYGNV